ncbi:pyridine nucleotide-disulfide oxidoreductase-domain-containing protein [Aspergillus minisclerotigenes]|uniref:Pyridine nucleotide-disulfide oxidoreductase-domain-containing protein n=1 Tax=Aspergillus minisclerotigenes TaxID=656917 RepID=A0A5N6IX62_9EURO|nr:pyridine nucleotide-disulfide oxidoreductase-domain-containing protein [Aspergillus minisclerotigenes]
MSKPTIAIIGSGWGGYNLAHSLNTRDSHVVVVSPEATSSITPLLASAACGLFNSQLAQESIRRKHLDVQYVKASACDIRFEEKIIICQPAFDSLKNLRFELSYDKVVIAPGCSTNTNTPGVNEHAFMVKNVNDANAIRDNINENLEIALLPTIGEDQQRKLLHIAIASVTVHDVAPNILAPFDRKLSEYAQKALQKYKVEIKVNSHIVNVTEDTIETREDGTLSYGLLIWATGNKQRPLVDQLNVMKSGPGLKRILTDDRLCVVGTNGAIVPDAYAIGDAADIDNATTYLARALNSAASGQTIEPFTYHQRPLVMYTGASNGVIMGKRGHEYPGYGAWLSWRSGNFFWTRSWKRKFMMVLAWFMDWVDGREMARF